MKLSQSVKAVVSGIIAISLVGCASIVDGRPKKVTIKSQPPGAKVTVFDKHGKEVTVQETPAIVRLKRGGNYSSASYKVVIEKAGFKTVEVEVKSTINGWYFGNILFGGLIGLAIVDPITGAMWTLTPKDIDRVLETQGTAVVKEKGGFLVMLRQDVPEEVADGLVPVAAEE